MTNRFVKINYIKDDPNDLITSDLISKKFCKKTPPHFFRSVAASMEIEKWSWMTLLIPPFLSLSPLLLQDVLVEKSNQLGTLSNKCVSCNQHVHLVQRHLVEGKLYHRSCAK